MTSDEFLQRIVDKLEVKGELISCQKIIDEITILSEAELFNLLIRINK